MSVYKFEFFNVLVVCGFIYQVFELEVLDVFVVKGVIIVYIGFDCIVVLLYVGLFLLIMMLYWLQQIGYWLIVLMGGGMMCVGDLSGKDESCCIFIDEMINQNFVGICVIFVKFFKFEG